jgi:predicted nucleotidyltransferase
MLIVNPEINALISELLAGIQAALGKQFVALYLHGSLANGDFAPGRSDIDFLVVTEQELSPNEIERVKAMHRRLTHSGMAWADVLEGGYISRKELRCYNAATAFHPSLRVDGSFDVDGYGSDWIIQRYLIRKHAFVIAGPEPKTLIDEVTPDQLREAQLGILREWWLPQLTDSHRIERDDYQAYAVLTMCRALYTVTMGDVASKPAAARFAQRALGEPWAALIEDAAQWREGMPLNRFDETLAFIRFTLLQLQIIHDIR